MPRRPHRAADVTLAAPRGLTAIAAYRIGGQSLVVLRVGGEAEPHEEGPNTSRARTLTASEREVAILARQGLSNAEIARRRATSPRTVAVQLASAYRKLGIGSRGELPASLRDR